MTNADGAKAEVIAMNLRNCLRSKWMVLCGCSALLSGSLGVLSPALAQSTMKTATTVGSMRVQVLDEAQQPLAGAKLHVSVWTDDKTFKPNRDYTCDAAGVVDIALPERVQIVRLWASKEGHAHMFLNLQAEPQAAEFTIP